VKFRTTTKAAKAFQTGPAKAAEDDHNRAAGNNNLYAATDCITEPIQAARKTSGDFRPEPSSARGGDGTWLMEIHADGGHSSLIGQIPPATFDAFDLTADLGQGLLHFQDILNRCGGLQYLLIRRSAFFLLSSRATRS